MTTQEQYNRTICHLNMTDEVHANCEECGARIPVELTRCDDCETAVDVSAEEWADNSGSCCPDCERPNQFGELCPACVRERDTLS